MNASKPYILIGPEEEYNIPKKSFGKIIYEHLRTGNPDEVINFDILSVYVDAVSGDVLTYGILLEQSIKFSSVLKNFSMEKGDVIAIVSENTVNYIVPILAAFYLELTVNPLNPDYSEGELQHGLQISKAKLVLSSENALKTVLNVKKHLKFIENVLLIGPRRTGKFTSIKSFEHLLESIPGDVNSFEPNDFDYAEQVAFIVTSSGTTGLPKAAMITHRNLRTPVGCLSHPKYGNTTKKDVTIVIVPFFHIYGCVLQLLCLITNMKSVFLNKFRPDIFLKTIQEYKVTKLFLVPTLVQFLRKSKLVDDYDTSSVEDILVGTAPLGKELQSETAMRLGGIKIRQMYGLTETTGPNIIQTDMYKPGSIGYLVPGVTAKVCDPDTKELLGPMKRGEICLKGPMVMKGYISVENPTDEDGFLHTGDVGYYDHDGSFYIVDRLKELIKYKGFQVSPAELEALIITHSLVDDCGVIGVPDKRTGQVPFAFVVLNQNTKIIEQDIIDYVAERISPQKRLYGGVKFIDEIPRTASGKIMRRKLLEMFRNNQ